MAVYVGVDSGAPFDDACIETFKDMKDNGAYKYLIFRVQTDGNKIKVVVDKTSQPKYIDISKSVTRASANFKKLEENTLGLGLEPLLSIFGKLDLPEMLSLRTVCKSWSKYIDDNEERVVRQSLISGKKVYSKFDVANVGFASWRQFITERVHERKNYKAVWNDLPQALPDNECRFIVYRIHEPAKKPLYLLIQWAPDVAPVRQKMIYSSTKMFLFRTLSQIGLQFEVQASEKSELNYALMTRNVFFTAE